MSTRTAIAIAALLASACGGATPRDAGPERVELGTGTVAFEPLAQEDDLELIAGLQGGHHLIVHARITGMDPGDPEQAGLPENPRTSFAAFGEDGRQLDLELPAYTLGYVAEPDGWYALPSGRILQVREDEVNQVLQQRVRVSVRVVDARGAAATDERWVRVIPFSGDDAGPY